ncbi:MAG: class I SAM-dependent methyltransferase [Myxacorys chilensis ATA2-1-KO14]|jgi:SAM-dependent methyltransferase|nr:class I SAM-dependent methyltransferase [Myxacorys chilensis ATA2-1-KO14]
MTIDYYNRQALAFFEQTVDLDMQELYQPFLSWLAPGSHILDAGCGSGRDTKAFLDLGYQVSAIDASEAMVQLSSEFTGRTTLLMTFEGMAFENCFDGAWACASLLHVSSNQIHSVFQRFERALKPNGMWYLSFKLGNGERWYEGRFFNDFDEARLGEAMSAHPHLNIVDLWQTEDRRHRSQGRWLNALVTKRLDH